MCFNERFDYGHFGYVHRQIKVSRSSGWRYLTIGGALISVGEGILMGYYFQDILLVTNLW